MFRLLGIVLWLAAAVLVAAVLPSMITSGRLGPEQIAILAILVVLAWSLLELAFRAWRVFIEHRSVGQFQTLFAKAQAGAHPPATYSLRDPRAVRRVNHMLECSQPDMSKLHEAVPAVASLDAAVLSGAYGPLNVYAWVLPVLGFMGTALGMAEAISGFKDALGRTKGDLNVLVDTLALKVVPGLAGAFYVTILALGASLVVYLCTSAIRDWDQEALHKLDRLCVVMLSRVPLPEGPEGQKLVTALAQIQQQIGAMGNAPASLQLAADAIASASQHLVAATRELQAATSEPFTITSTIERGRRPPPPRMPTTDGDART